MHENTGYSCGVRGDRTARPLNKMSIVSADWHWLMAMAHHVRKIELYMKKHHHLNKYKR